MYISSKTARPLKCNTYAWPSYPQVSMQALQATDPSSPEQPSPPIAVNLFNPICYGFFAPKNSSSKPPTPFPACLRVSVVSPAFVKSPDSEWHTPVKPATRERQIDIAEPGVSLGMYMCGTQAHSQATREHGSTQVEDTPKKNPAVATHAQGYAEQACTSPTVNCIPTPATHKRPKFSDDAALKNRGFGWRHRKFGQRSAVSEHEGRKAGEETGRGDGRVGADEAGTAMALRGEHDARSASTQEEGRLN